MMRAAGAARGARLWPPSLAFRRSLSVGGARVISHTRLLSPWEAALALLLALVVVLHLPSLTSYFHGDDFVALIDPASKPVLPHIADVFLFRDSNFYWRPLGELYYLAMFKAFGLNPVAFHAASLLIYLATVCLLYYLCLRLGLPRGAALGACCLFALLPNHVVSVAWITNAPRLQATFFFLVCLVLIAGQGRRPGLEAWGWLAFLAAALSDETALALAPVPLLLSIGRLAPPRRLLPLTARVLAYALPLLALTPLQFMFTLEDEPRLADYHLGTHVFEQAWVLTAQLSLPLHSQAPLAEPLSTYSTAQWTAGALTLATGLILLLAGSWLMRLLVVWTAAALAPFTLWDLDYTAPRYVYMAAVPFSIAVAWLASAAWQALPRRFGVHYVALAGALPLLLVAAVLSAGGTLERNQAWHQSSEPFRVLAGGLKEALPQVNRYSRLVIYYGVWEDFPVWPRAVVRTIYGDPTLDVVNVRRERVETDWPRRQYRDVVVYYVGDRFIVVPPARALATP